MVNKWREGIIRVKKGKCFLVLFLFILSLLTPAFATDQASEFYPAKVRDISDRAYESAVIQLLDNAKESIVMSMYMVKPTENGPVYLLVKDLEEAIDRGVSVEIYLNTRPDHGMSPNNIMSEPLQALIKKGAKIYKISPNTRLHDKVIIVDSRYVVEGSMNWSVAAIKANRESAVLIDSPELAKAKLIRARNFPLEGDKKDEKPRPDRPKGLEPLPKGAIVRINSELLNNKNYFPAMLKTAADRAMDMYLLLLAESTRLGEDEFFVPLENLAVALGMDRGTADSDLRRQMIKVLKKLENDYKLIEVNFSYGKDAWVELKELPGETFKVGGDFFDSKNLASKSQPAKFVFLIKAMLEEEDKSIESVSVSELAKRFRISEYSVRKGVRETGGKIIEK